MTDQDMEIWKAGFDIHQRHGDGPKTEMDWIALAEDCRDLNNRFGGSTFAFNMAMMMLDYYSDMSRNGRKEDTTDQTCIAGC